MATAAGVPIGDPDHAPPIRMRVIVADQRAQVGGLAVAELRLRRQPLLRKRCLITHRQNPHRGVRELQRDPVLVGAVHVIFVSKIAPNIYVSKYTFSALTCIIT